MYQKLLATINEQTTQTLIDFYINNHMVYETL